MRIKIKNFEHPGNAEPFKEIKSANYLLHSMIKQLDIFIGDTQINPSTPTYAYKAYFEALLGYGMEAKKSHLTSAGWMSDNILYRILDEGVKKPLEDFRQLDLYGRIHSDIAFQGKSLLGGLKLVIRILLHEPKFYIISKEFDVQLEFLEAALHVHRSKVPQYIVDAHNAALRISPAKYPLTLAKVKSFTIQKGTLDINIDNVHNGQLPRRIFIAFVSNSAYLGNYKQDPFYFNHFNISMLAVYVNGEQYPSKPFTPDFNNQIYEREMISIFEALYMMDDHSTVEINRTTYGKGNTIFGFNFTPDLTSGVGTTGHLSQIKFGTLRLSVRFGSQLTEAITALVYCEFDKILEIDINRNVNIDLF